MYSKLIDVSTCIISDVSTGVATDFEPSAVLRGLESLVLGKELTTIVTVSDGIATAEYDLDTFLSKTYRIINNHVRFGSTRINLSSIAVSVGWKIQLEDLAPITEYQLD